MMVIWTLTEKGGRFIDGSKVYLKAHVLTKYIDLNPAKKRPYFVQNCIIGEVWDFMGRFEEKYWENYRYLK